MKNKEIAKIFYNIASILEADEVAFKPYAYNKAAMALDSLEEDVEEIYLDGGLKALEKISGIGKNLALKIEEYLKTGKIKHYEELKKKMPADFGDIIAIEGMGPKKAKILYQKLGIKNVKDLEKAAKSNKIAPLFGFGEKTEKNILEGIEFLKAGKGRFLLGFIMPEVEEIIKNIGKLKEVKKISIAGSIRRMKETIGDVDILAVSDNPNKVMDFFVSMNGVEKIWGKGETKSSIRLKQGFDVDLRIVGEKSFGSASQYFTGSKEHNIAIRRIAMGKGLKLNEYGLFKGDKMIAGKNEEDIYKSLGLLYIPPEMRENEGEIELSLEKKLPKIIDYKDLKGDLHCHSNWDGGENSIEEIAEEAINMGYEYIGISDHTKFLKIENGLDEEQLLKQSEEIKKANKKIAKKKFRILHGCEANILNDGSIDIKDEVLKKLDYVIAGIHSNMKMERREMTERIIKAIKNPNVDIISHPTGRIMQKRDEYQIDFDKILRAAKETGTILEINSYPERLDLKDIYIRMAKKIGVRMAINADSHNKNQMGLIKYGIAQARRGWAEKKDIANTQPLNRLLKYFKDN